MGLQSTLYELCVPFFLFLVCFLRLTLPSTPSWPGTHYVDEAELREIKGAC